eukprot:SAG31_NODE_18122_length_646_cov_0.983547_1_plen_46_part_10
MVPWKGALGAKLHDGQKREFLRYRTCTVTGYKAGSGAPRGGRRLPA